MALRVVVSYRKSRYLLDLKNKITIVGGDSGTGRSNLTRLLRYPNNKFVGVSVIGLPDYGVIEVCHTKFLEDTVKTSENKVVIIDRLTASELCKTEIVNAMKENKTCYFVLMGRYNCARLGVKNDSLYKMVDNNGVNVLEQVK